MLRDNLVGLIEPMRISAGVDPLALSIRKQASDDRSSCLENPRPEGAESSLTENVTSPFQAEPAQSLCSSRPMKTAVIFILRRVGRICLSKIWLLSLRPTAIATKHRIGVVIWREDSTTQPGR
jgi:hypothetical protein